MKPYEPFICQECTHSIDYEGYYGCRVHKELEGTIFFNSPACKEFDPRFSVKNTYRITVLEIRVKQLEEILNKK